MPFYLLGCRILCKYKILSQLLIKVSTLSGQMKLFAFSNPHFNPAHPNLTLLALEISLALSHVYIFIGLTQNWLRLWKYHRRYLMYIVFWYSSLLIPAADALLWDLIPNSAAPNIILQSNIKKKSMNFWGQFFTF